MVVRNHLTCCCKLYIEISSSVLDPLRGELELHVWMYPDKERQLKDLLVVSVRLLRSILAVTELSLCLNVFVVNIVETCKYIMDLSVC